jgi:hypothetical protein
MSDEVLPMKKILYKGQIVEVKERNLIWLEKELKRTGETSDQALERLMIETNEQELAEEIEATYQRINNRNNRKPKHTIKRTRKTKPNPNTLDYYMYIGTKRHS